MLKVLNSQLLSRMGFVAVEINIKGQETVDEIDDRALAIGDPDADCIRDARVSLDNAIDYAGYNINGIMGEVIWNVNQIESTYFYPLINVLKLESNIMQSMVMTEIHRYNPVTDIQRLLDRLDSDYHVLVQLYESALASIEREWALINDRMNEVKRSMFPQLNSVRDYFIFNANLIKEILPSCNATPDITSSA